MAEAQQSAKSLYLPQWNGYLDDEKFSEKILAAAALQQEQERALNDESIEGLIATHSKKDEEDPVGIRNFALGDNVVKADWLRDLASNAVKKKQEASRHVEDAKKEINRRVGLVNEKDSHKLAETLRVEIKEATDKVKFRSDKLNLFMGDTPQDEALRDSHGDKVETMSKTEKTKAFQKEEVKRISDREEEVDNFVASTTEDTRYRAKVDSVYSLLDRQGKLKSMKEIAEGNINDIQKKMVEEDQVLDSDNLRVEQLRDDKDEHLSELAVKRALVTELLQRLLKESAELSDAEAKYGAMALKLQQLEQDLESKTLRKEGLDKLADDAIHKLDTWKSEVETGSATLAQEVEKAMGQAISKHIEALKEVALRKQVALQLCQKCIDQKDTEIREKASELRKEKRKLSKLLTKTSKSGLAPKKERLWKSEHEQNKKDAQAKIESLTETINACKNKLEGLKRKHGILENQYKHLLAYEKYGTRFGKDTIEQKALEMAEYAHEDFEIFGDCEESSEEEEVGGGQVAWQSAEVLALWATVERLTSQVQAREVAERQREVDEGAAGPEVLALQAEIERLTSQVQEMEVAQLRTTVDEGAAGPEANQVLQPSDMDHGDAGGDARHDAMDREGDGRVEQQSSGSHEVEVSVSEHKHVDQEGVEQGAHQPSSSSAGEVGAAEGTSTVQKTTQEDSGDNSSKSDTAHSSSGSAPPTGDSSGSDFQLV